jgi:hypothetical protein
MIIQDQSQDESTTSFISRSLESNNLMSNLSLLICGF